MPRAGLRLLEVLMVDTTAKEIRATDSTSVRNRHTQRLKGFLDHLFLALIRQRPRYGFELVGLLQAQHLIGGREGSVYPVLGRMTKAGLIRVHDQRDATTGRVRRYYEITAEGESELLQLNTQWEEFKAGMDSIFSREEGP